MHQEIRFITNPGLWAKEIINSMRTGMIADEQGKEALFRLLLLSCGAKAKEIGSYGKN